MTDFNAVHFRECRSKEEIGFFDDEYAFRRLIFIIIIFQDEHNTII